MRLQVIPKVDLRAPVFRGSVTALEKLEPGDSTVHYGFFTENMAYSMFSFGEPAIVIGG